MRKESLVVFLMATVLSLGIVGGLHYFYLQSQSQFPEATGVQAQTANAPAAVGRTPPAQSAVEPQHLLNAQKQTAGYFGPTQAVVNMRI